MYTKVESLQYTGGEFKCYPQGVFAEENTISVHHYIWSTGIEQTAHLLRFTEYLLSEKKYETGQKIKSHQLKTTFGPPKCEGLFSSTDFIDHMQ